MPITEIYGCFRASPRKRWVCRDNRTGKRRRFHTQQEAQTLAATLPMGEVFKAW